MYGIVLCQESHYHGVLSNLLWLMSIQQCSGNLHETSSRDALDFKEAESSSWTKFHLSNKRLRWIEM